MYIIRCKSKTGEIRYVANSPVGRDKVWYSIELGRAYTFEDMGNCKSVRDVALGDNDGCDIMVKQI